MVVKKDQGPKLQCPDCDYSTRSETQFVKHLINEHACTPHQAARLFKKAEAKAAK